MSDLPTKMISGVTSEIWQDQFLESISCDVFSDGDHLDVNSNDRIDLDASKDEECTVDFWVTIEKVTKGFLNFFITL